MSGQVCVCGHPYTQHYALSGACSVDVQVTPTSTVATAIVRCACLGFGRTAS